ncbi:response regulator [Maribacter sp. 2307ULW6-5]|uniref:hybrid sensor histidine kinase/response regulator n=1 Tax=Maribacter sp. 2307ULW6-5 TaxID=3386275 RepID=UPI0039BCF817
MNTNMDEGPVNIAIIDDERMNLEMLGFIISQMGYEHIRIQQSTKAIAVLLKTLPDLILLDVQMPQMDGFELCALIKARQSLAHIPIIFITGMNQSKNKIKGLELGGVDYVTKPFNPPELKARIRTHVELALAKKSLEAQSALKDRIFSIIGHDLRSPLSAAKLKMDFILRGIIDPKQDDFLDGTVKELSRTMDESLNLLQNLLGWAKSESGQIQIIAEKLQLYDLADQTCRLLQMASGHKDIALSNEVDALHYANADMNTIKTVLRNLVSNAIKFTPKGGRITLSSQATDAKVTVSVTDNGLGISKKNQERILDRHTHFSKLGTDQEPGTGLGLVLCQSFIEKNGGRLGIESEEGKGSTFYFELPLAPANGA